MRRRRRLSPRPARCCGWSTRTCSSPAATADCPMSMLVSKIVREDFLFPVFTIPFSTYTFLLFSVISGFEVAVSFAQPSLPPSLPPFSHKTDVLRDTIFKSNVVERTGAGTAEQLIRWIKSKNDAIVTHPFLFPSLLPTQTSCVIPFSRATSSAARARARPNSSLSGLRAKMRRLLLVMMRCGRLHIWGGMQKRLPRPWGRREVISFSWGWSRIGWRWSKE